MGSMACYSTTRQLYWRSAKFIKCSEPRREGVVKSQELLPRRVNEIRELPALLQKCKLQTLAPNNPKAPLLKAVFVGILVHDNRTEKAIIRPRQADQPQQGNALQEPTGCQRC